MTRPLPRPDLDPLAQAGKLLPLVRRREEDAHAIWDIAVETPPPLGTALAVWLLCWGPLLTLLLIARESDGSRD